MRITYEELRRELSYDHETGVFVWLPRDPADANNRRWNSNFAGAAAGTTRPNGYVSISLRGKRYYAHRLAWLYMTGLHPKQQIDHIDRDRNNNRFANLREASVRQNHGNASLSNANTSGRKGVSWHKRLKKWRAQIRINGVSRHLGYFEDTGSAAKAYAAAANRHFGEFACTG